MSFAYPRLRTVLVARLSPLSYDCTTLTPLGKQGRTSLTQTSDRLSQSPKRFVRSLHVQQAASHAPVANLTAFALSCWADITLHRGHTLPSPTIFPESTTYIRAPNARASLAL